MKLTFENITPLQLELICAIYEDAGNGARDYDSMYHDNFSWFSGSQIMRQLGWDKQKTAGVISGAMSAGIVDDSGNGTKYDLCVQTDVWMVLHNACLAGKIPFPKSYT